MGRLPHAASVQELWSCHLYGSLPHVLVKSGSSSVNPPCTFMHEVEGMVVKDRFRTFSKIYLMLEQYHSGSGELVPRI
jgi:hypothetical protein